MKLGCFGFMRHLPLIKAAGFDSAELDICEIVNMTEEEFKEFRKLALDTGLGYEVFSGLIPLTEHIISETFDMDYWLDHVKRAAQRIVTLGAEMVPFGAGKCRSIPENCKDVDKAKEKVIDFVGKICDVLNNYGITVVVEPLGPANSNYINFIGEAVNFIKSVNRPNCKTMCDLRHMHKLNEDMNDIIKYKAHILHAHIDYPLGEERLFPKRNDGFDYRPYIKALLIAGYHGLLTVEATSYKDFFTDAKQSIALFNNAGLR